MKITEIGTNLKENGYLSNSYVNFAVMSAINGDGCAISDPEAEELLLHGILEKEKKSSTYMDLINLTSHPIVLSLHKMDVQKYFVDAPELVIKFLKLRYKNAATYEKKILKHFFLTDKKK